MPRDRIKMSDLAALSEPTILHDGAGLYLDWRSVSSSSWTYRYQLNGRTRNMGLGSYPEVSLARARQLRDHWARYRSEGVDPVDERARQIAAAKAERVKEKTIKEWMEAYFETKKKALKAAGDAGMWWSPVQNHVLPKLGGLTLRDLSTDLLVEVFSGPWHEVHPTATKAWSRFTQAVKFAADDRFDLSILTKARAKFGHAGHKVQHHAALPWREVPALFAAVSEGGEKSDPVVNRALAFYILTVVRASNVTGATWEEIDATNKVWSLPAERMKTETPFRLPLAWQASRVLGGRKGKSGLIFPSTASRSGIFSENTFNKRLKPFGTTAHGIRSSFADWAVETGAADPVLADMCLAHIVGSKVRRAYQRTDRLEQRRVVMQAWADFVTGIEIDPDFTELVEEKAAR